jgi:putative tRNA adenosine deaminase-associated protein
MTTNPSSHTGLAARRGGGAPGPRDGRSPVVMRTRCAPRSMREGLESDTISLWKPACGVSMTDMSASDFAVVVYREDDVWEVDVLPPALTEHLDGLIQALRQQPGIGGAIGLAAVGDDFFVALRVIGNQVSVFLSDVTASVDWPLARQVLDYLDIPVPEDEDLDQVLPVGDMSIFADLGVDEMDLGALSGNLDLFPDEVLASIARRLGFGPALERALDSALGA